MSEFINTIDVLGEQVVFDSIADRSITEMKDNIINSIGSMAFINCVNFKNADFPLVTDIGGYAFAYCSQLENVNFPVARAVGQQAFVGCKKIKAINMPLVETLSSNVFLNCTEIEMIDFSNLTSISSYAFEGCTKLKILILRNTMIATLSMVNAFFATPIRSGTGYIYVPRALLDDTDSTKDYRQATNWSTFATQFRALEDYTVDGTISGAMDWAKINAAE